VRILGPVVEMTTGFLARLISNHLYRGPIGGAFVRHHGIRISISPHCFLQEFQRSSLIPLLRDIGFQDFAFVVDSAPKIVALSSNLDEDLIQVPLPLWAASYRFRPMFPDLVREVSAEPINPEADTFVTDIDPAFVEKVLDIAQRQRESDIHHHAKLDDLRRGFKVAKRVRGHFPRLNAKTARLTPGSADNTLPFALQAKTKFEQDGVDAKMKLAKIMGLTINEHGIAVPSEGEHDDDCDVED
jgi:hypothetical protein